MALSLSKTYLLARATPATARSFFPSLHLHLSSRAQSNIPSHPNYVDLSDDSSSSSSSAEPLIQKLEDAIHRIIVRRSAPDWLPFLPGSSYWVPPHRSTPGTPGIAELLEKLAHPLTDEETLSTSTVRGWPSSDFFIKGGAHTNLIEVKVTINNSEAETGTSTNVSKSEDAEKGFSNNVSKSEDEEG